MSDSRKKINKIKRACSGFPITVGTEGKGEREGLGPLLQTRVGQWTPYLSHRGPLVRGQVKEIVKDYGRGTRSGSDLG